MLVLILITVGMVFSMSTRAAGTSNANNEVMNSLRSLERQLRSDLTGLRKDAFVGLWYNVLSARQLFPDRPTLQDTRADWLVFFSNGEFSTMQQAYNNYPVASNIARVHYGMVGTHSQNPSALSQTDLGRFAKLLVNDPDPSTTNEPYEDPPPYNSFGTLDGSTNGRWDRTNDIYENWEYEYESVASWQAIGRPPTSGGFSQFFINSLIGFTSPNAAPRSNLWLGLPYLDATVTKAAGPVAVVNFPNHLRMIPGCARFKVQRWKEWGWKKSSSSMTTPYPLSPTDIPVSIPGVWWPEDALNSASQGDFTQHGVAGPGNSTAIWEYFNAPPDADAPILASSYNYRRIEPLEFPKALKITVTLFDTNRRMEKGQTFTMVIPLE